MMRCWTAKLSAGLFKKPGAKTLWVGSVINPVANQIRCQIITLSTSSTKEIQLSDSN